MSLLLFEEVTAVVHEGRAEIRALDRVTMDLDVGEVVAVQGQRRSGRTTLLRIASGATRPNGGRVRFAGRDLAERRALGREIGWAHPHLDATHGRTVVDQVAFPLLPEMSARKARRAAAGALERTGIGGLAAMGPVDCRHHELLLAGLARAMVTSPRMLVLDEPTTGLDALRVDRMVTLLRELGREGVAVLLTTEDVIVGADRMLTIHEGEVRGRTTPQSARIFGLRGGAA